MTVEEAVVKLKTVRDLVYEVARSFQNPVIGQLESLSRKAHNNMVVALSSYQERRRKIRDTHGPAQVEFGKEQPMEPAKESAPAQK